MSYVLRRPFWHRMQFFVLAALIGCCLALPPLSSSQVSASPGPFGAAQTGGIDSINLGNLNVELKFPIVDKPQRGANAQHSLTYNSSSWLPRLPLTTSATMNHWIMPNSVGWKATSKTDGNYIAKSYSQYTSCGVGDDIGVSYDAARPFNIWIDQSSVEDADGNLISSGYFYTVNGTFDNFSLPLGADSDYSPFDSYPGEPGPEPTQCGEVGPQKTADVENGFVYVDFNGVAHPFGPEVYCYYNIGPGVTMAGFPAMASDSSGYMLNYDPAYFYNSGCLNQQFTITSPSATNIPFRGSSDLNGNSSQTIVPTLPLTNSSTQTGSVGDLNGFAVTGVFGQFPISSNQNCVAGQCSIYNQPTTTFNESWQTDMGQTALTFGYETTLLGIPANQINPQTATFQRTYSYVDESGITRKYALHYKYYSIATNFGCSGITESSNGPDNYAVASVLPVTPAASATPAQLTAYRQAVTAYYQANMVSYYLADYLQLPDGRQYQFTYESTPGTAGYVTGRIATVTLPAGGSISYSYGPMNCADGSTMSLTRTVSDANGNNSPSTYTRSQAGAIWTTAITDPQQNYSSYQFITGTPVQTSFGPTSTAMPGSWQALVASQLQASVTTPPPLFYEIAHKEYQGSSSSSNLLRETDICYNNNCNALSVTSSITARSITTTLKGVGGSDAISYVNEGYDSIGNLVARAGPASQTQISYVFTGPVEKPFVVSLTDGNKTSTTVNWYDEPGSLIATSGLPHHWSGYNYGNLTSVYRTSATFEQAANQQLEHLLKTCKYYDTGKVQSCLDANAKHNAGGSLITYTYDVATGGLLTAQSVTNPDGTTINGVSHTVGYGYETIYTGNLTSATDENNRTTTYTHDMFSRPTSIRYPDGGSVAYCYADILPTQAVITSGSGCGNTIANSVTVTQMLSYGVSTPAMTTVSTSSMTISDGLSRPIQSQLLSDPSGVVKSDVTYDLLGRILSSSTPYRSLSDPTYGVNTFAYDALGRTLLQCHPDNGTGSGTCTAGNSYLKWMYSGNTVSFQDENKNIWTRNSDAAGRLTSVVEPGGLLTTYSYDTLGNLLCADQWGATSTGGTACTSSRARKFRYDTQSRLTHSTNPESGTIRYTYDFNGNLLSKTSPLANAASGTQTTTYKYDALNRLVQKSYPVLPAGSPARYSLSCYQYDQSSLTEASATGNFVGRLTNNWTTVSTSSNSTCPSSPPSGTLSRHSFLAYDPMGRFLAEQQCTAASCGTSAYTPSYTYDLAGNVLSHSSGMPSGTGSLTFTNTYDAAGRLATVKNGSVNLFTAGSSFSSSGCANAFSTPYSPAGGLANATFGTGLQLLRTYDQRFRINCETDTGNRVANPTPGAAAIVISGTDLAQ